MNITDIEEGKTFYKKNDERKYHFVKVFKDEYTRLIVYKFYGIVKQWWHYRIETYNDFMDKSETGLYYT